MVTETSLNAYRDIGSSGLLNRCESIVHAYIEAHPGTYDTDIAVNTNIPLSNICGRRNALMKARIILKAGKTHNQYTKETNNLVQAYEANPIVKMEGMKERLRIARKQKEKKGRQKSLKKFFS